MVELLFTCRRVAIVPLDLPTRIVTMETLSHDMICRAQSCLELLSNLGEQLGLQAGGFELAAGVVGELGEAGGARCSLLGQVGLAVALSEADSALPERGRGAVLVETFGAVGDIGVGDGELLA
jgi:hypothetical protein